jgi:hypothetical protein
VPICAPLAGIDLAKGLSIFMLGDKEKKSMILTVLVFFN